MGMKDYIIRRSIQNVILFLAAMVINFFIFHLIPGDPASYLLPPGTEPETRRILREQYGFDKPVTEQFVNYLKMVASGKFGHSFIYNRPVGKVIFGDTFLDSRILNTLILMGTSLALAITIGTLLGLMAAWKRGSKFDYAVSISSLVVYSLPVFFVGLLVILFFGIHLHWIPITGTHTPFIKQTRIEFILDYLHHLLAPMFVITLFFIPNYFIITRNNTLDIFSEDFMQTAEAKGLSDRQIVFKHAGKNSFLPTLSLIAIQMNYVVAGAMLTETVFSWPGIGRMTYEAILAPDYPLLEGMFLIIAAVVITSNFIADILYAVLDPRIRY
ncbi:MAG: ABC transporter permease [Candidatus Heimdallarchaeota archaeon]